MVATRRSTSSYSSRVIRPIESIEAAALPRSSYSMAVMIWFSKPDVSQFGTLDGGHDGAVPLARMSDELFVP